MAENFIFKDVSRDQVTQLSKMQDIAKKRTILVGCFGLDSLPEEKREIMADFLYGIYQFCVKHKFSHEKTSALLSIMNDVFQKDMEDPFVHLEGSFNVFSDLLLRHSVQRPPYSIELFSLEDIKAITDFATWTYFRHLKLYKYAFTKKRIMDISTVPPVAINTASAIPPLNEADMLEDTDVIEEGEGITIKKDEEEKDTAEAEAGELEKGEDGRPILPTLPPALQLAAEQAVSGTIERYRAEVSRLLEEQQRQMLEKIAALEIEEQSRERESHPHRATPHSKGRKGHQQ